MAQSEQVRKNTVILRGAIASLANADANRFDKRLKSATAAERMNILNKFKDITEEYTQRGDTVQSIALGLAAGLFLGSLVGVAVGASSGSLSNAIFAGILSAAPISAVLGVMERKGVTDAEAHDYLLWVAAQSGEVIRNPVDPEKL